MILPTRARAIAGIAATFIIAGVVGTTVLDGTFSEKFDLYPLFEPVRQRLFTTDDTKPPAPPATSASTTTAARPVAAGRADVAAQPRVVADAGLLAGSARAESAGFSGSNVEFGSRQSGLQATSGGSRAAAGGGGFGGGGGGVSGSAGSSNSNAPRAKPGDRPARQPRSTPPASRPSRPPAAAPAPPGAAVTAAPVDQAWNAPASTGVLADVSAILSDPQGPMSMSPNPEPGSLLLMTTGVLGAYGLIRRRKSTRR